MAIIEMIVPCLNEEECIELFYDSICDLFSTEEFLKKYNFSILFIDDGSRDNTLAEIKRIQAKCEIENKLNKVRYISFSRNFGKEAAIYAGLENSKGDYVALIDADLQHPPRLMIDMLGAILNEGYDCATARRIERNSDNGLRKKGSDKFFKMFCHVTGLNLVTGSTDYRLMKRSVVEAILSMPEKERFIKGIYSWVGFKNKWIEYQDVERIAGNSKWTTKSLIKYAYHGFVSFATTPLRAVVYLGMVVVVLAILAALYVYILAKANGTSANGYATIMIVMLLLNGVIITILGVIGEYLARIYMEVKNRPIYIVRESKISDINDEK